MFGARHYWCAAAGLLAQLVIAAPSRGSASPTTVIVSSNMSDARLTRALVLIRGELSALGLDVQVRGAEGPDAAAATETTSERLSFELKEGAIVVRVFAAGAQTPLVESVDLDGPDVTAEVIAVRAVEALRAARLLPAQAPRVAAPKPPPEHPPEEPPPPEPPAEARAPVAKALGPTPPLQLSLGPTFIQNLQGLPQLGAQAALWVGPSWGFAALGAESSIAGLNFERAAGSAQISRQALFLLLGARIRLHQAWEVSARGGVSYLHYGANGAAQPGYLAQDLEHGTGGVSLSFRGAYYFARAVGVYLDLGSLVAFDAARVRLGDESVVTLDQPSFALGFGALLGAF
jgi:hypothetical protein